MKRTLPWILVLVVGCIGYVIGLRTGRISSHEQIHRLILECQIQRCVGRCRMPARHQSRHFRIAHG